jgi:hypothetical protein
MNSSVNVPFSNLRAAVIVIVAAFHSAAPGLAAQPAQSLLLTPNPFAGSHSPFSIVSAGFRATCFAPGLGENR